MVGLFPQATLLPVMSGEDLPYNMPTSPQSSLSQTIADSLSTDGGILRSWCNSGSCCCCHPVTCPADVMFRCTDAVQVLLHVVSHCEDDQQSVLSPCSIVLGVSSTDIAIYCAATSACLLAACLRHVHTHVQGPWASFFWCFSESVERPL